MILNFERNKPQSSNAQPSLVLIHGLFGSLSNLGMIGRAFSHDYDVIQIDVRNHGHSAHSNDMNYADMANDVIETLNSLGIDQFSVIGHSMGGKIAMALTETASERLKQLVVLDIAPVTYTDNHHQQIFNALLAVRKAKLTTRKEAAELMKSFISEEMVIQFLLKSFAKEGWLFNVESLYEHYFEILAWKKIKVWDKPSLFIRGGNSPYIQKDKHILSIDSQFADAQIETIENVGHWLHAEKPEEVITMIKNFLIA